MWSDGERAYLDHAGTSRPSGAQLAAWARFLAQHPLSNPHSRHASARETALLIEQQRSQWVLSG